VTRAYLTARILRIMAALWGSGVVGWTETELEQGQVVPVSVRIVAGRPLTGRVFHAIRLRAHGAAPE